MATDIVPLTSENQNIRGLLAQCEAIEASYISLETMPKDEHNKILTTSVACLLTLGEISSATLLLNQVPSSQRTPEINALFEVTRTLTTGSTQTERVFPAIQSFAWNNVVASVMTRLADITRQKAFRTIEYGIVHYLKMGLSAEETIKLFVDAGWEINTNDQVLTRGTSLANNKQSGSSSTEDPLALLTKHVLHMEHF
ncbi:hypothetical protein BDF22DRAFT_670903 [Syncephalis plumigaleata]|nr:hypothetical protein BDF22DRAFT_670903 [Syncephalis plumigaleata]